MSIYCPGHAGVSEKERADRLASTADITSGPQLGTAEVLRGLRDFLNMDRPEHWSPEGNRSGGRKRSTFHHPKSGNDLWSTRETLALLGETAEWWDGACMGLSEHYDAMLKWNWWATEAFVGCLTVQLAVSLEVAIWSDSCACSPIAQLHLMLAVSLKHSLLTPDQPVLALTP